MFAVIVHFPFSTITYKSAVSATDILNFEVLMTAHGYNKILSKIEPSDNSKISSLVYSVWFDKE